MKKTASAIPAESLAVYDQLVANLPNVERKGVSMPYTAINGNMFSFLTAAGALALRLPADAREAFMKKHNAKLCEQHGTVLKEYVEVPAALMAKPMQLQEYLDASYAYARDLKPKSAKSGKARTRRSSSHKST